MNRRQRRKAFMRRATVDAGKVPVFGPRDRVVALVTPSEARRVGNAPNARLVRSGGGQVVQVTLAAHGDDTALPGHQGDPRHYSHDHETENNLENVWTMRHLSARDPGDEVFVRRIYCASVLDNLVLV